MEFTTIKLSIDGAVATLALNRPDRLNALNATVHAEIREAMNRVEANAAIHCLVITGEGRAFCSGQDLTERVMSENTQIAPAHRSTAIIIRWYAASSPFLFRPLRP